MPNILILLPLGRTFYIFGTPHEQWKQYLESLSSLSLARFKRKALNLASHTIAIIGHVWYINILTWIQGFWVKIANFLSSFFVAQFSKETWIHRKHHQIEKFVLKASKPCSNIDILNVAYCQNRSNIHKLARRPLLSYSLWISNGLPWSGYGYFLVLHTPYM